jgi:hypothetical protein
MTEAVHHKIEERLDMRGGRVHRTFVTRVFRGGEMVALDLDTGESEWAGGECVATLFRRTFADAMAAAMSYSRITRRET